MHLKIGNPLNSTFKTLTQAKLLLNVCNTQINRTFIKKVLANKHPALEYAFLSLLSPQAAQLMLILFISRSADREQL